MSSSPVLAVLPCPYALLHGLEEVIDPTGPHFHHFVGMLVAELSNRKLTGTEVAHTVKLILTSYLNEPASSFLDQSEAENRALCVQVIPSFLLVILNYAIRSRLEALTAWQQLQTL